MVEKNGASRELWEPSTPGHWHDHTAPKRASRCAGEGGQLMSAAQGSDRPLGSGLVASWIAGFSAGELGEASFDNGGAFSSRRRRTQGTRLPGGFTHEKTAIKRISVILGIQRQTGKPKPDGGATPKRENLRACFLYSKARLWLAWGGAWPSCTPVQGRSRKSFQRPVKFTMVLTAGADRGW